MKILVVSNLYPPYVRGGAEIVAHEMVQRLREEGERVDVLTTQPWHGVRSLFPHKDAEGIYRFFPLNIYHTLNDYRHGQFVRALWHVIDMVGLHSVCVVFWVIIRGRYDRVITHNLKGVGMSIALLLRMMRVRHEHYLHDVQLIVPSGLLYLGYEHESYYCAWYSVTYRRITRWLMKGVSVVMAPSQWVIRIHQGLGFFKTAHVQMIHYPVLLASPRERVRRGDIQFLYVGQLSKHKGILFLLTCLQRVSLQYGGQFSLVCVGDGPLLSSILSDYGSCAWLHVVGRVPHEELASYIINADYVVFPTLCYENAPNVIKEAHQYQCPVVASDIGGVAEGVAEGDILVDAGDADAWCDALKNCLEKHRTMQ